MSIDLACSHYSELLVEAFDKLRQVSVGLLNAANASQAQFFDKAVLQRLIGPLNPPFGLRRVCADHFYVEFFHRSCKLCDGFPLQDLSLSRAKYGEFIRIKGQRSAVRAEILVRCIKVGKCSLSVCELKVHQAARRVVYEDKQCATISAPFEPVVRRAVYLHKFAQTRPSLSQLMNMRLS